MVGAQVSGWKPWEVEVELTLVGEPQKEKTPFILPIRIRLTEGRPGSGRLFGTGMALNGHLGEVEIASVRLGLSGKRILQVFVRLGTVEFLPLCNSL